MLLQAHHSVHGMHISALCRSVSKLFVFIILLHNERLFIKFLVLSYKAINNLRLIYSIVMEAATYDR